MRDIVERIADAVGVIIFILALLVTPLIPIFSGGGAQAAWFFGGALLLPCWGGALFALYLIGDALERWPG